MNEVKALLRSS